MECSKCPLNKNGKVSIRRQRSFGAKLRIVMSHPPLTFVDMDDFECQTVALLKRWIHIPFDVVFTLNCTNGRLLNRTDDERLPSIAANARAALKCCSGTLKADLEGAEVVVLCGNSVLEAFGLKQKVTDLTGWVAEEKGVSYLATYDPHDVEEYPVDKWKDWVWTVQRAAKIVNGLVPRANIKRKEPWVDIQTVEQFAEYAAKISDDCVLSVDLETAGLKYWDPNEPILQIGIWEVNGSQASGVIAPSCFNNPEFVPVWNESVGRVRLLGQNHKFDYCYTRSQIPGANFPIWYDIRMIHHLIDERTKTHDLGRMLQVYLNWEDYWSQLEHYLKLPGGYSNAPYNDLAEYLALDLVGTGELFLHFMPQLLDSRGSEIYKWPILMSQTQQVEKIYRPLGNVLAGVELRGSRITKVELEKLRDDYAPRVEQQRISLEGQLLDLNGEECSIDSSSQLLVALQKAKILPRSANSVKKRVLADFMNYELIRELLKYRADKKLLDTFINGSLEKLVEFGPDDIRLMCKFDPVGTIGSRWTCVHPNLQQLPKKGPFKGIFIPSKPGRIIVQDDFSALEARVAAFLSGDEALRDGCLGDLHTMVAERSFKKYLDELERLTTFDQLLKFLGSQGLLIPALKTCQAMKLEPGEDALEKGRYVLRDHLRNCAKVITYGIFFGRGPKALAVQELRCEEHEAKYFIDEYFKLFPKLYEWIQEVHRIVEKYGIIEEPGGLRRDLRGWMFSPDIQLQKRFLAEAKRKAVNFMTQTFGGNIQNLAFIKTDQYLVSHGIGEMRKGVHDSMVYELDFNSDTRYHLAEIRKLHKVIKEPYWLCETDTECGWTYGSLQKEAKFFAAA